MKNIFFFLTAALIFAACGNSHHRHESKPKEVSDSISIPTTITVHDSTLDEKFYAEMFYKKELIFGGTVDSTITAYEGEGVNEYQLPVKVTYGNTTNFAFRIITSYEYYPETDTEVKGWELQFKLRNSHQEGKTLAEDKKIREAQSWKYLDDKLQQELKELLPETTIPYPKKFVHKGLQAGFPAFFIPKSFLGYPLSHPTLLLGISCILLLNSYSLG